MTYTRRECVLLNCNGCGHDFDFEYVPHFDSEDEADTFVRECGGLVVVEDGTKKHLCETCVEEKRDTLRVPGSEASA